MAGLSGIVPGVWANLRGWSKEQVSTYQGGALARMGCLGFIGRRWEYRRVHYELTEDGKAFIKDVI